MGKYDKQTWVAREGVDLNRFAKTSETSEYVKLTNSPVSVSVEGTQFSVDRMNHMEDGIKRLSDSVDPDRMFPRNDWPRLSFYGEPQESSRIQNGSTTEVFYAGVPQVLRWGEMSDYFCSKQGALTTTDVSNARFPYVFKSGSTYYLLHLDTSTGSLYMKYSTNKTNWSAGNGGNPVLTKSTDPNSIYYNIWNSGVIVIDGVWHFFVECGKSSDQSDVGIAYSYATLSGTNINFDANRGGAHIVQGGGQPNPVILEGQSYLTLFGGSIYVGGRTLWEIRAYYIPLTGNFANILEWRESPYFQLKFDGLHTADPDFVDFGTGKKFRLGLGFMWNQATSDMVYLDMTPAELMDGILNGFKRAKTDYPINKIDVYTGLGLTFESGSAGLDASSFFAWEVRGYEIFFQCYLLVGSTSSPSGRAYLTLPFTHPASAPISGHMTANGMSSVAGSWVYDISGDRMYLDRFDLGAQRLDLGNYLQVGSTIKLFGHTFTNLK